MAIVEVILQVWILRRYRTKSLSALQRLVLLVFRKFVGKTKYYIAKGPSLYMHLLSKNYIE